MCPCDETAGHTCGYHRDQMQKELERIASVRSERGDLAAEAEMQALCGYYGRRSVNVYLASIGQPAT